MFKKHWQQLMDDLKHDIPAHDYEAWFNPIKYLKSVDKTIYLSVPTSFNQIWLSDNYLDTINKKLNNIAQDILDIEITVEETGMQISQETPSRTSSGKKESYSLPTLMPNYTFNRFVVGKNNELANAAALKVAQNPGKAYNPLFLYGGVGLGKTHLMHAIGHKIIKKDINKKVSYLTSEEFMNLFVDSIRRKTQSKFRNKFRNLDLLLLDDVQFLLNKHESKNELFNTFNALHQNNKQIVISSDRTPKQLEIDGMDDRLTSRIGSGLELEIHPPSIETRQAILRTKAIEEKVDIPNEVITFIASIIDTDIRQLEKALIRIIAEYQLLQKPITLDQAKLSLKDLANEPVQKNVTIDDIMRETANAFNMAKAEIKSKSRTSQINLARQIVMYLARELTELSLKEIGLELQKEHPTIISGVRKIKKEMEIKVKTKDRIEEIKKSLFKQ